MLSVTDESWHAIQRRNGRYIVLLVNKHSIQSKVMTLDTNDQ